MTKLQDRLRLPGVRRAVAEVARPLRRLRRVELARRGARGRATAAAGGGASLRAAPARRPARGSTADIEIAQHAAAVDRRSTSSIACSAAASCPGSLVLLGGEPGIGKSTLLLQAAANMARDHRPGALQLGRGIRAPDQVARRAAGGRRRAALSARRNVPRAHPRGDRAHQAGARHRRFDSDGVLAEVPVGARQHRPGARGGDAAAVHGQGTERADVPRRPRHQGRQPRRAQGARARRRHRAVFRGRAPSLASRRARREEPVRRGQRARRVRDDVGRPAPGAESVEAVSRRAAARTRPGRRCSARSRARGRFSSRCRRSSAPAPTAPRGAWPAASISSGCRCCSRCSRSAPAST